MPAQIFGNRFVGTVPAWHGLMRGEPFKKGDRLGNIIDDRGMGVVIDKRPLGAMMDDGNFHIIPNRYSLFRRPTADDPMYRNLGEVAESYSCLSDDNFAALVDVYLDKTGWDLETFGYLDDGATIWAGMRGKEFSVAKEDYRYYFHAIEHRDGKRNGVLVDTPVCIVCANTMSMAMKNNRAKVAVRHTNLYAQEMTWRMNMIADAVRHGNSVVECLKQLHKIAMDESRFGIALDNIFPMPALPASIDMLGSNVLELRTRAEKAQQVYERDCATVVSHKAQLLEHFTYVNEERKSIANTALAGFQAVTGWLDHDRGKKATENQKRVRAEQSVFGDGPALRHKTFMELIKK